MGELKTTGERIKGNPYVGRGIVIGKTPDGKKAAAAYFIMGRSANSRNRIFSEKGKDLFTEPFDVSKVEDPSLIIYRAMTEYENHLIVTNGDQTDTVYEGLKKGISFSDALKTREFEPDSPNFTPRISGILTFGGGDLDYDISILKSADEKGSACFRYTFSYKGMNGTGHFIHTYITDGSPLPSFEGEPEKVKISDDIDKFTSDIWNGLDENNRISLYVRYLDLESGKEENRLINKLR